MRVTEKQVREKVEALEKIIEQYKLMREEETKGEKRDWRTYEENLARRLEVAMKELEPLIDEAVHTLHVCRKRGRKPTLTLKQKVTLLLIEQLVNQSNRTMASILFIFSLLTGIKVGYKTVERLYSDLEVYLALCNLHRLILKKKGIKECDASGDETGYSLSISKHYREEVNQRGDKAKGKSEEKEQSERKAFVYTFCLMDLDTKMYLCYGTGMGSEKEAFKKAMRMLGEIDVRINSV
ncbi:MAG TPA: hypothetical protein HA346_00840 [Thermoplasmata archaeon]|nr:hypothetical protein [Thermoplasmata archaeon]